MKNMLRRILAGLLDSKKAKLPKHVHMTRDGVFYTSANELIKVDPVIEQIGKLDSVRNGTARNGQASDQPKEAE